MLLTCLENLRTMVLLWRKLTTESQEQPMRLENHFGKVYTESNTRVAHVETEITETIAIFIHSLPRSTLITAIASI